MQTDRTGAGRQLIFVFQWTSGSAHPSRPFGPYDTGTQDLLTGRSDDINWLVLELEEIIFDPWICDFIEIISYAA